MILLDKFGEDDKRFNDDVEKVELGYQMLDRIEGKLKRYLGSQGEKR
jgi:hypothetical protein